jgi:BirA family biotin operon repressor/biotin-[acetyl-CoA-carboxylase] ligase
MSQPDVAPGHRVDDTARFDPLDAEEIRAQLGQCRIGRAVVVVQETTSTNDMIASLLKPDFAEGFLVFAERQTSGRGQRGNRWESAQGKGLWCSMLLRPEVEINESARITTWIAKTILAVVQSEAGISARVKPPNDIFAGDRKIAGVLVEMKALPQARHAAVAGFGINVNHAEHDFPPGLRGRAASIAMIAGKPIDRQGLAVALLRALDASYPAMVAP